MDSTVKMDNGNKHIKKEITHPGWKQACEFMWCPQASILICILEQRQSHLQESEARTSRNMFLSVWNLAIACVYKGGVGNVFKVLIDRFICPCFLESFLGLQSKSTDLTKQTWRDSHLEKNGCILSYAYYHY